jgi:hypothetical protein
MALQNSTAMVPATTMNTRLCSCCLGAAEGGAAGHMYKGCLIFLTGQPSRNPKWNYAASGPDNFKTGVTQNPQLPQIPQPPMLPQAGYQGGSVGVVNHGQPWSYQAVPPRGQLRCPHQQQIFSDPAQHR